MADNYRSGLVLQGQPVGNLKLSKAVAADGTLVDPNGYGLVELIPDSATATSRTITLVNGSIDGQVVTLVNVAGSSYSVELADSGNVKLQYAWYPLQDDSLTLMWSVYRSAWIEVGRTLQSQKLAVSLTADDTTVTVLDRTLIEITSDDTTAANRTFVLTAGLYDGQRLALTLVSDSSTTCQLADSGTVKLSAAWEPLQWDTLHLVYSATATAWLELARADN